MADRMWGFIAIVLDAEKLRNDGFLRKTQHGWRHHDHVSAEIADLIRISRNNWVTFKWCAATQHEIDPRIFRRLLACAKENATFEYTYPTHGVTSMYEDTKIGLQAWFSDSCEIKFTAETLEQVRECYSALVARGDIVEPKVEYITRT